MKRNVVAVLTILLITFQLLNISSGSLTKPSETNSEIRLSDSHEFSVKITFVGSSPLADDEIVPLIGQNNVYDFITNFIILPVRLKIEVSGYTNWNLGNVTINGIVNETNLGSETITAGQIFLQVDNTLEILHENALTDLGFTVPLTVGDHTISILYIGNGPDGIVHAKDEIVARIRNSADDFDKYVTDTYDLELDITDVGQPNTITGEVISNITTEKGDRFTYYLENILTPTVDISMFLGDNNLGINDSLSFSPEEREATNMTINGTVNTLGFSGLQIEGSWQGTQGISFLIDASGLHPLVETTKIVLRRGLNYIGILSLSPYGLWHQKIPCLDDSTCEGEAYDVSDWQGSIIEEADSSFDFIGNVMGHNSFISIETPIETTETEDSGIIVSISFFSLITMITVRRRRKL